MNAGECGFRYRDGSYCANKRCKNHPAHVHSKANVARLVAGATAARDAALSRQRRLFHLRFGRFWKCTECGCYLEAAIDAAPKPPTHSAACGMHPNAPVFLAGYSKPPA